LFSPYVQTEIGRRQGGKGSGLGLALVRQIVRLSNGRLGVDSEYGKGSVFWFELPYAIPVQKKRTPSSGPGMVVPRPPLITGVSTIDEESASGSMVMASPSPAMERDDPLDRIECRGSEGMPLTPLPIGGPSSGGQGQSTGTYNGTGSGQERPKLNETESTMPLLSRTPSGRIRRESGKSPPPPIPPPPRGRQGSRRKLIPSTNRRSNRNNLPTPRFRFIRQLFIRSTRSRYSKCNANKRGKEGK
jgi:hypothetical protein